MIGVFDSGSGGLSVLKELRLKLPSADILYFGDIKNVPYGTKTQEELSKLTAEAIDLLHKEGVKHIVSACNSVAASLVISMTDRLSFSGDIIEMVGPTVSSFKEGGRKLALCATPATIDSGIYQSAFSLIGQEVQYIAIPDLAAAIEFGKPEEEIEKIIREAFFEKKDFDTLILSCTHYPLVKNIFERVLGNEIEIFDPSVAVAERGKEAFVSDAIGTGQTRFIISQESTVFRQRVAEILPDNNYTVEVLG